MKAKCQRCNYEWETKSRLLSVSCPNCNTKVTLRTLEDFRKEFPVDKGK